ncbi:thermonuclease family protein [Pelagovum pacificum]|uniref:Thermonuclease family protein n=1 Tax=Pelagovum pacificum TaxID=2588711 RepID=A0A5C5GCJ1_9RHOB|nr:thermonuclease family protein [Pelagovum pacificum]QQA41330.1 thermonuclease family protein [Pelagovum pacificum]TNY31864.1 thermonuclease family protein [Pelagovum pacificum]
MRSISLICLALAATPALADVSGTIRVKDGDTFEVAGADIRLFGIDAPEQGQTCTRDDGATWDCGAWVTAVTEATFGGEAARCVEQDIDRYGRIVAICTAGGVDVGDWLVTNGLAFAYRDYSMMYDTAEKDAAVRGAGLWSGEVQTPAEYRAEQRQPGPSDPAPAGCDIKGNVSSSGRIYHRPGDASYADTRITLERGERWFCSVEEAEAAGWRAPRN